MFGSGDRVVLAHDCKDLAHGPEVFKKGETGTLGRRYRVQDGIEVWELILDKKRPFGASGEITLRVCVDHTSIERL